MKITETIERECCDERKGDLRPYQGAKVHPCKWKVYFCAHCGQIWIESTRMDGPGSSETYLRKITIGEPG